MKYWIWLQEVLGYGSSRLFEVLDEYGSAENVYNNRFDSKCLTVGERKRAKEFSLDDALKVEQICKRKNIGIITYNSKDYPECLKNISNPPTVLYYRGHFPNFDTIPSICIVGPREATEYGLRCAYSLAGRLGKAGFTIVSGGALGCDFAAHKGVLLNGGVTVALLGNGFGDKYLKSNEALREEIAQKGCLVTEYRPYTSPAKYSFPLRNRLLSALSLGTVVIEAGEGSGSLITANCAAEQNKDIFVIPGSPGKPEYSGSNKLLQDGAKPVIDIIDIVGVYLSRYADKIDMEKAYESPLIRYNFSKKRDYFKNNQTKSEKLATVSEEIKENSKINKKILPEHLSKNAKMLYNQLDKQIFVCDDLLSDEFSANDFLSAVGELEIYGLIKALPGGRYTLI